MIDHDNNDINDSMRSGVLTLPMVFPYTPPKRTRPKAQGGRNSSRGLAARHHPQ